MNPLYEGDKEESTVFNLNHQRMVPFRANWQRSNSYPSTSGDFRDASTIDLEGRHRKALAFKYSSYRTHKDPKCLGKQVVRLSTKKIGRKGKARSPLFPPSSFPWTFPAECFLRARTCCNAPTPHCWPRRKKLGMTFNWASRYSFRLHGKDKICAITLI
jgi:hypothetical protein